MPQRTNPWPSFVDLYLAMFVLAFGGLVLMAGRDTSDPAQKLKNKIIASLRSSLKSSNVHYQDKGCGEDICFDLYVHFQVDKANLINPDEIEALRSIAENLKIILDDLDSSKSAVEINIEGHTDSQVPSINADAETKFLYNWGLSSRRAFAVLYKFAQSDLRVPKYKISAIGYADSQRLCNEETEDCYKRNRRVTLRIRIDTKKIEEWAASKVRLVEGTQAR